jgi:putative flippase GtrA
MGGRRGGACSRMLKPMSTSWLMIWTALPEKLAFVIVGGTSALGYLLIASLLHSLGLSATLASVAAYLLSIPPGYFGQRWLTFRSTRPHNVASIRYVGVQTIGLLIAAATTFIASVVSGVPALLAFLLSAATAASASYLMQRLWVF